jgi:hypothetical protein
MVGASQRPVLAWNDPLDVLADSDSKACLSRRPIAAKKSFTIWTFFSMLIEISPLPFHRSMSE